MKYVVMVFLFFQFNVCFKKHDNKVQLEQVVKDAFRLSFERKYDSLSEIMPEHFFKNTTKDYQLMAFSDLARAVRLKGDVNELDLKTYNELIHGEPGSVVTFYPDKQLYNVDSLELFKIDSIRFYFLPPASSGKVAQFRVYGPMPILKGIVPTSEFLDSPRSK